MLYIRNLRNYTRKLIEIINYFSVTTAYKINLQILIDFAYASSIYAENELINTLPSTKNTNTHTHFVINITKELKDFYTNLKRLMKTLEKGKIVHALELSN